MADNTDEEYLDSPTNNQSEIPPDEIIPTNNPETITQNQETENMEVHHHPDLHHKSKKWKEYFLEFLMIFLAVTMGFIAENIREHFVLKKHEKEYMVSLVRDLSNDIAGITRTETTVKRYIHNADSIFSLFKNADFKNTSADIYYFGRVLGLRNLWRSNDGTIQQLIYSGGLRMIENKSVIDSIQDYINNLKQLSQLLSLEDAEVIEYRKAMDKVFSGYVLNDMINTQTGSVKRLNYNPDLQSTAKNDVNDLLVQIAIVKTNRISQLNVMEDLKIEAASIIKLINKEYSLE
jgi:hypothetical protein